MSIYCLPTNTSSTGSLTTSDASSSSSTLSSSSSSSFPSTVPTFSFVPPIRYPPPLTIPEIPLRERRRFTQFVTITPRPILAAPMPAKGQLEPKAGALPRRRRASAPKPVVITESKRLEFSSESDDEED